MNELSAKQIEFLNELLKGRPLAAIVEDLEIHYKELFRWKADPTFAEELAAVNGYMQFLREMDIRVGATEATRRARITVEGGSCNHWLSDRQRRVGKDLVQEARQLDPSFKMHYRLPPRGKYRSPIREEILHDAKGIVERMEALRARILEERRREREKLEGAALPAPPAPTPAEEGAQNN